MPIEEQIVENLRRCPHFKRCSQNLCPLDLELCLRKGGKEDKCRWMREPKKVKIKDKEFISGGVVMPDAPLKFVSESNLKWLNEASQKRWHELQRLQAARMGEKPPAPLAIDVDVSGIKE